MKTLEHTQLSPNERARIEVQVDRYRNNILTTSSFFHNLCRLGYEPESVRRYIGLVDSTLDDAPAYDPPPRHVPWWELSRTSLWR